ncbi:MAG: hypothetical protein AAGI53_16605 [Planctomycetota bacterium]
MGRASARAGLRSRDTPVPSLYLSKTSDECLQRTNIALWRKADEFEPGTNSEAWSTASAKIQAKAARKTAVRERRLLSEASFDAIADAADADQNTDQRTEAPLTLASAYVTGELDDDGFAQLDAFLQDQTAARAFWSYCSMHAALE